MPRALFLAAALATPGCVSIPLGMDPATTCPPWGQVQAQGSCQRHLVVGLFPSVGEAHLNRLATNGAPLTPGMRTLDYTLRPLAIAGINLLSLGIPTVLAWILEPYAPYDPAPRECDKAIIGYCKSGKWLPVVASGGGRRSKR